MKIKLLIAIFIFTPSILCLAEDKKNTTNFIIEGEVDSATTNNLQIEFNQLQEKNNKIKAEILELQDKLLLHSENKVDLRISLEMEENEELPNYGILQLNASLNNIGVIEYKNPLIFDKNEEFPLFEGSLPLGDYELQISAIVGQQIQKRDFILPEGHWSLDKKIKFTAKKEDEEENLILVLRTDDKTGLPQLEIKEEESE